MKSDTMTKTLPVRLQKGTGDPIVLLHGLGNSFKSWTYAIDNFDYSKNQIIALDLLGFGDAPKPSSVEYTVVDHADAVIQTLDKMGVTSAVIAGHSMGCLVATEVAVQRPDIAKKLVLLGAPLFNRLPRKRDRFKFWKREDFYSKLFRIISTQKDLTLTAANAVVKFLPLVKGMEVNEDTWPAFKKSLRNTIMQTKTFYDLTTIKTPTQLVYGKLDLFVIKSNLKKVAHRNRKFVTYESALGPHEITPIHGKSVATLLQK